MQNNGISTIDFTNARFDSLGVGVPRGTTNLSNMDDKFVEIPSPLVQTRPIGSKVTKDKLKVACPREHFVQA